MVKYDVLFTAQLTNIVELESSRSSEHKDVDAIMVECKRCCAIQQKTITVICEQNWPNLRSAPNPRIRCNACGQTGGVMVVDTTTHPLTDEYSINGILVPLMQIECVGYIPVECIFGSGWRAETVEGATYDNIDLSAEEVEDYDEGGNLTMAISNPYVIFKEVQDAVQNAKGGKKWNRRGGDGSSSSKWQWQN